MECVLFRENKKTESETCCLGRNVSNESLSFPCLLDSFLDSGRLHVQYGLHLQLIRSHPLCCELVSEESNFCVTELPFLSFRSQSTLLDSAGVFHLFVILLACHSPDHLVIYVYSGAFQTLYYGLHYPVEDPWCQDDAKWEPQKKETVC